MMDEQLGKKLETVLSKLKKGELDLREIDNILGNYNLGVLARRLFMEIKSKTQLPLIASTIVDFDAIASHYLLNPIGSLQTPLGVLGPLRVNSSLLPRETYIPVVLVDDYVNKLLSKGLEAIGDRSLEVLYKWVGAETILSLPAKPIREHISCKSLRGMLTGGIRRAKNCENIMMECLSQKKQGIMHLSFRVNGNKLKVECFKTFFSLLRSIESLINSNSPGYQSQLLFSELEVNTIAKTSVEQDIACRKMEIPLGILIRASQTVFQSLGVPGYGPLQVNIAINNKQSKNKEENSIEIHIDGLKFYPSTRLLNKFTYHEAWCILTQCKDSNNLNLGALVEAASLAILIAVIGFQASLPDRCRHLVQV